MNSRITVTIVYNGEEYDFSVPSGTAIKELENKMSDLFPHIFHRLSMDDRLFYLKNEAGYLSPEHSLNDYGVMDGAKLELVYLQE